MAKDNAIHGSFAALPLFLIWLQASWMIVLSGAELSFATQNVDTYEFEPDANLASHAFRKLLSLRIVNLLIEHFSQGEQPMGEEAIARTLSIPIRLLRTLLFELVEAGLISPVRMASEKVHAFQPAFDPDHMSVASVLEVMELHGVDTIPVLESAEMEQLRNSMETMREENRQSPANMLLRDIGGSSTKN